MAKKKKITVAEEVVSEEKTPIKEKTFEQKKKEVIERIEKMEDDSMYIIEIDGQPLGGIDKPIPGKIWKTLIQEIDKIEE